MTQAFFLLYGCVMKLQIPENVINRLHQSGLRGDPNEWTFKVVRLSGERAYLWFSTNDGFTVTGTQWEERCMADSIVEQDDHQLLSASSLALRQIKGHTSDVYVYPDGSLAWQQGKTQRTVTWRDNAAVNKVKEWEKYLVSASNKWWIKATLRRELYERIAQSLSKLAEKIAKS